MSLPGFTAEASLYQTSEYYQMSANFGALVDTLKVSPQQDLNPFGTFVYCIENPYDPICETGFDGGPGGGSGGGRPGGGGSGGGSNAPTLAACLSCATSVPFCAIACAFAGPYGCIACAITAGACIACAVYVS